MLVFYGDNVSVANSVPKVLTGKTKGLLFLKLQSGTLDEKSMGKEVLMLELTRSALADLEGLLEEVYRPLLSNPVNQEGWGDVASKETVDKLHNFLAATTITLGQTRGETLLPLPSMDGLQETTGADGKVGFLVTATSKERIHLLEGVRGVPLHGPPPPCASLAPHPSGCHHVDEAGQGRAPPGPGVPAQDGPAPDAGPGDPVLAQQGRQPELDL